MATPLSSNLYPPLIDTFMPAFPKEGPAPVTFSISSYNSKNDIKKIHISLVDQLTNKNVLFENAAAAKGRTYEGKLLDGLWIIDFDMTKNYLSYDQETELYLLKIPAAILKSSSFNAKGFYKLQIRFDKSTNNIEDSSTNTAENSNTNATNYLTTDRASFSEWSSVCLLKGISKPTLVLTNFETDDSSSFNAGIILVSGQLDFEEDSEEKLMSYSAKIYEKNNPDNILDSVESVFTGNNKDPNEIYWLADCESARENNDYVLEITLVTKNQYTFTEKRTFTIWNYEDMFSKVVWEFDKNKLEQYNLLDDGKIFTKEDGIVKCKISLSPKTESDEGITAIPDGYLYIKRGSSLDNYKHWELIKCTYHSNIRDVLEETFEDWTVGSLVQYIYSIQYQTKKGLWSKSYKSTKEVVYPDFYNMLLYRQGKQLAIRYDGQITSLRPVVNRQKIDTLGGKYPKFAENAKMNYKQFSISGLIDAESDFNRKFFSELEYERQIKIYDLQMDGKYQVRNDTVADNDRVYENRTYRSNYDEIPSTPKAEKDWEKLTANTWHDLYPMNNWWLEREFREEAIKWLNDGEPKLFRSMPEGNMAVMLTDISLTPNHTLGRRIYSFSATMYEIEDGYSLEILNSLGIVSVPNAKIKQSEQQESEDTPSEEDEYIHTIGQFHSYSFPAISDDKGASLFLGDMEGATGNNRGLNFDNISVQDYYQFIVFEKDSYEGKTFQLKEDDNDSSNQSFIFSDVRIYFESKPQWYDFGDSTDNIILIKDKKDNSETNNQIHEHLGYKIGITPWSSSGDASEILIFVNDKGYYQTPSNLKISNLIIYDGATATVNYKVKYQTEIADEKLPSSNELERRIVGQVSDMWLYNTSITPILKEKHKQIYYENGKIKTNEYLSNWHAVSLELTPYTIIKIQFKDISSQEDQIEEQIVGRTGIYNLVDSYPLQNLIIRGKRMVRVDKERQPFLDDWEYVLDNSAIVDKENLDIWDLTWKNININGIKDTDILVNIEDRTTTKEAEEIKRLWNSLEGENIPDIVGYSSTTAIKNPKVNTVYGIKDEEDSIKYMIYYQDYAWYEVEFEDEEQTIIHAAVPVHGMISYWADIIKQTF